MSNPTPAHFSPPASNAGVPKFPFLLLANVMGPQYFINAQEPQLSLSSNLSLFAPDPTLENLSFIVVDKRDTNCCSWVSMFLDSEANFDAHTT